MKTIYIAGPLTADTLDYLANVRHMAQVASACIRRGWAPFCPGIDFVYFLVGPFIPSGPQIKAVSMEWLRRSDAMVMIGAWRKSRGCRAELRVAKKMKIPIYYGWAEVPECQSLEKCSSVGRSWPSWR